MRIIGKLSACLLPIFMAGPVQAATFISFNGSTGVFGNDLVTDNGFSDVIDLGNLDPGEYLISATLSSSYQPGSQAEQDIDFTQVKLNNSDFTIGTTGQFEYRYINSIISSGPNLFTISGSSGSNSSYSGTVNIASVPEPGTWGMFIIGMGVVGFAMRRTGRARRGYRLQAA